MTNDVQMGSVRARILVQLNDGEPKEVGVAMFPIHGSLESHVINGTAFGTVRVDPHEFTTASKAFVAKLEAFIESL